MKKRQDVLAVICFFTVVVAGAFAAYEYVNDPGAFNFAVPSSSALSLPSLPNLPSGQAHSTAVQVTAQSARPVVPVAAAVDRSPASGAFIGPVAKTSKRIDISLKDQSLTYYDGAMLIATFKISSGLWYTPTKPGTYSVIEKFPVHEFKGFNLDGTPYDLPNTKYNLLFHRESGGGNLYIHGAYWHHNFGHPMSHGCINASYADMELLYPWADIGTIVTITQ